MGLIKNILKNKEEKDLKEALTYLYSKLKIGRYENMSLQEYFLRDYRANCYYYSTYILLCMKPTDRLCRGIIHLDGDHDFISRLLSDGNIVPNYEHGWIEFEFKGKWWVYDDHYNNPIPLEEWEKQRQPLEVYKKFTQTELLEYLTKKYADQIKIIKKGKNIKITSDNIWDFKYDIPFPYVDMILKNGEIKKLDIDLERKVAHY